MNERSGAVASTRHRPGSADGAGVVRRGPARTTTREQATEPRRLVEIGLHDEAGFLRDVHDVDRYPGVPTGAMRLAWRQLRPGTPACLYVPGRIRADAAGLSLDLSEQCDDWHLMVVVPLGADFVTLRLRPGSEPVLRLCLVLYGAAAEAESASTVMGESARKVARIGADRALQVLADAGEPGPGAPSSIVLRGEVQALPSAPGTPSGGFGPLTRLMSLVTSATGPLGEPTAALPDLTATCQELASAAEEFVFFTDGVNALCASVRDGVHAVTGSAPVLANAGEVVQKVGRQTAASLRRAEQAVLAAHAHVERLASWTALVGIASYLLAEEAADRIERFAAPGVGDRLDLLARVVQHASVELAVTATDLGGSLSVAADRTSAALDDLTRFHRWLGRFRLLVTRADLWRTLGPITATLDRHLVGVAALDRMRLTERICRSVRVDVDVEALAEWLDGLRTALADAQTWPSGVVTAR